MSYATSTEGDGGRAPSQSDFRPWHLYALLSMAAAAAAVWAARNTHPLALLLISAAVLAAGFVGLTLLRALAAFLGRGGDIEPLGERAREVLEREKALALRSIKELEFDHAMGKVGEADFKDLSGRLRARALSLMQDLERAEARVPASARPSAPLPDRCRKCGTTNESDAKFCKNCGDRLRA